MIRTAPSPQNLIVGGFFVLLAVVAAVAPLPLAFRSLGILLASYLAFGMGGMPFAYVGALLAPPIGLITGDVAWLVMLPIVLSSNLLGMLGLEFAWRYAALVVSPALVVAPLWFVMVMSERRLFEVELPWEPGETTWILLHGAVALGGVLIGILLDRRRSAPDRDGPRRAAEAR